FVMLIYFLIGEKKVEMRPLIAIPMVVIAFALFGPFTQQVEGIYRIWCPEYAHSLDFISDVTPIAYQSNIYLLDYVFSQFIPTAICVALLLNFRRDSYDKWIMVATPLLMYSTFAFVGMAIVMILIFIYDLVSTKKVRQYFRQLIRLESLAAILVAVIFAAYLACNVLQTKPEGAGMSFILINYDSGSKILALILVELSWIMWVVLLLRKERRNPLMWVASIVLLLLPFFQFGLNNDLCMRASMPALLLINILMIKNIICSWKSDRYYMIALLFFAFISALGVVERNYYLLHMSSVSGTHYNLGGTTFDEFISSQTQVDPLGAKYQYIDYDIDGPVKFILR
ncbi:MAG: hypothetical protein ACOYIK_10730, partial [Coriobacteriales bacterium]